MARPESEKTKPTAAPKSAAQETARGPRPQSSDKPVFTDYASL